MDPFSLIAVGIMAGIGVYTQNQQENALDKAQKKAAIANAVVGARIASVARDALVAAGIAAGLYGALLIVTKDY